MLRSWADAQQLPPLAYRAGLIITFVLSPVFLALQMGHWGMGAFLLHLMLWGMQYDGVDQDKSARLNALHLYGFGGAILLAAAFGVADNYGMPVAFLLLSWIVLSHSNVMTRNGFQLIGGFEIGLSIVGVILFPTYIPAIAILFGLACLLSAGLSFISQKEPKA